MAGFGELDVSALSVMTTYEGEYGAMCTISAKHGESRHERTVGMVWGDHFYTQIDGATDHTESFAVFRQGVRDLVYYHSLGLGERRRRRYIYTPPDGWRGYPRGLVAEWFAPGFPKVPGFISVFPARPAVNSPTDELHRLLHEMSWFGFHREITNEPTHVTTRDGMSGHVWQLIGCFGNGPRLLIEVCTLADDRFRYVLRLESRMGQEQGHHDLFEEVIKSVQQLPRPIVVTTDLFAHVAR